MKTITAKTTAWITTYSGIGPDEIKAPTDEMVHQLYFSRGDMKEQGWTVAGEAEITVTLVDVDTLITNKVESLRAQLQEVRSDAQVRCNSLEQQIQKLLAITYDEPQAA